MSTEWLLSVHLFAEPDRLAGEHPASALGRLRRRWRDVLGVQPTGGGDPEDWVEQAYRLDAALSAVPADRLWLWTGGPTARRLDTGARVDVTTLEHLPRLGSQPNRGFAPFEVPAVEKNADRYMHLAAFARHAGRSVALCRHDDDTSTVLDEVRRLGDAGETSVVVKVCLAKYAVGTAAVHPGMSETEAYAAVTAALDDDGWTLVHLGGRPDAFLVQQAVPMRHEYRLFVIDGWAVTGAGCLEERTPLDNTARFDPAVRAHRNSDDPVEHRPDLVHRYLRFGRQVAADIAAERPSLTQYSLDVAMVDDRPVVIELNALLNSGLYASDPYAMTRAITRPGRDITGQAPSLAAGRMPA